MEWGPKHGCKTTKDGKGNIYMVKGSAKFYPTFINHIDTVHHDQEELVKQKKYKEIVWQGDHVTAMNPLTGKQTGLGMDNQGGTCIALAAIDSLPAVKAIFTVEEEVGMVGIRAANMSFFDDSAFLFSNDSPDKNRATHYSSGVQLYSDDFFVKYLQPICSKHGVSDFRSEPWTCIKHVRETWTDKDGKHLECLNFGNAGDRPHTDQEGASFSGVNNAEELLIDLASSIPTDVQHVSEVKPMPRPTYSWPSSSSRKLPFDFDWDDDDIEDAELLKPVSYEDRAPTDLCTIQLTFDDDEQQKKFTDRVTENEISVDVDERTKDFVEVFGELQEVQKAYILWYQLFYDMEESIKTWDDLVKDNGDVDFNNDVVFEEAVYASDFDDEAEDKKAASEAEDFWKWLESRK